MLKTNKEKVQAAVLFLLLTILVLTTVRACKIMRPEPPQYQPQPQSLRQSVVDRRGLPLQLDAESIRLGYVAGSADAVNPIQNR